MSGGGRPAFSLARSDSSRCCSDDGATRGASAFGDPFRGEPSGLGSSAARGGNASPDRRNGLLGSWWGKDTGDGSSASDPERVGDPLPPSEGIDANELRPESDDCCEPRFRGGGTGNSGPIVGAVGVLPPSSAGSSIRKCVEASDRRRDQTRTGASVKQQVGSRKAMLIKKLRVFTMFNTHQRPSGPLKSPDLPAKPGRDLVVISWAAIHSNECKNAGRM